MTRTLLIPSLLIASVTIGCAAQPTVRQAVVPVRMLPPPASSPSLAFTPSVARDVDVDLDRADRRTVAYAGYESNLQSVTYTYTDDDQRYDDRGHGRAGGDDSRYERRSISTSITVRNQ